MNEYLYEVLYQIGLYWCIFMIAPGLISLMLSGLGNLWNRILMHTDRRKRHRNGFVLYCEQIPGTNGYRIKMR